VPNGFGDSFFEPVSPDALEIRKQLQSLFPIFDLCLRFFGFLDFPTIVLGILRKEKKYKKSEREGLVSESNV
jgi:hypothetical protein